MAYFDDARVHFRLLGSPRPLWRSPQFGSLGATAMHWSLSPGTPTVISIPSGSGKTAVAMSAPHLLDEPPKRILVVAPTRSLREQLVENFRVSGVLRRIGALPNAETFEREPNVFELKGQVHDWRTLDEAEVVVALPNTISPSHYPEGAQPPTDLFDLVIIDEAHHAPAPTWLRILDHFQARHSLLLTATPVRRDGKRIPGELVYHYPLRRALDEGFYNVVRPQIIDLDDPPDREAADHAIATAAAELLQSEEHHTSVLLVRAGSIQRLGALRTVYQNVGIDLTPLHNQLSDTTQRDIRQRLTSGEIRAVGVVGMLGEGYDLPSLRIAAYHDKHKSLPATVQLIGRLARVDPSYPQESVLITARDVDVFPELRGVVRSLYDEDSDWAVVLPGIIDDQIDREREERDFASAFAAPHGEIIPSRLQPLQRAVVYEIADTAWRPRFANGQVPDELQKDLPFGRGRIVYSGVDPEGQLLVLGVQHVEQPRWTTDPGLAETTYALHLVAFRSPPRADLPGLLFFNTYDQTAHTELVKILELDGIAEPASPERIGQYIDGLERLSVSAVGMRSTNAANRGTTSYKNHLGASVDRGLRAIDMTRNALGHVNIQITDGHGSSNAGAALEKSKLWVTRYSPLRVFNDWIEQTATLLWFERTSTSGPLLPSLNRGTTLIAWPPAPALAAELNPALFGRAYQVIGDGGELISIEDVELYVAADPFGALDGAPTVDGLPVALVRNNRESQAHELLWTGTMRLDGSFVGPDLPVRHGHAAPIPLPEIFNEFPPTVYFLDGTTVVGRVAYALSHAGAAVDPDRIVAIDWNGIDITAETAQLAAERGAEERSVHEGLVEWLASQPRRGTHRWIVLNDGPGEIADVLVVEVLTTGEVYLGLWHAKASDDRQPARRINELQVVVAQAIRSRRWFPSLNLWPELAKRLTQESHPFAILQDGSDAAEQLYQFLGMAEAPDADFVSWIQRAPVIQGQVAVVQPGLSKEAALNEPYDGREAGVLQLLSVLEDTAEADGHRTVILSSP